MMFYRETCVNFPLRNVPRETRNQHRGQRKPAWTVLTRPTAHGGSGVTFPISTIPPHDDFSQSRDRLVPAARAPVARIRAGPRARCRALRTRHAGPALWVLDRRRRADASEPGAG